MRKYLLNLIPHIEIRIVFQPIKLPLHRRDVLLILYVANFAKFEFLLCFSDFVLKRCRLLIIFLYHFQILSDKFFQFLCMSIHLVMH